jgi:hypothetical protein
MSMLEPQEQRMMPRGCHDRARFYLSGSPESSGARRRLVGTGTATTLLGIAQRVGRLPKVAFAPWPSGSEICRPFWSERFYHRMP